MSHLSADWSRHVGGLRLFSNLHVYLQKTAGIVVPYWMPVIILTLTSFWLLLSMAGGPWGHYFFFSQKSSANKVVIDGHGGLNETNR